jgi:hypothetical protein
MSFSRFQPSLSPRRGHGLRLVVFDGDDTLWKTRETYNVIKQNFARLLREHGIQNPDVVTVLDEIDAARVATEGFTAKRFVDSLHLTYDYLRRLEGHPTSQLLRQRIGDLSRPLFQAPELYDDALPALSLLRPH